MYASRSRDCVGRVRVLCLNWPPGLLHGKQARQRQPAELLQLLVPVLLPLAVLLLVLPKEALGHGQVGRAVDAKLALAPDFEFIYRYLFFLKKGIVFRRLTSP